MLLYKTVAVPALFFTVFQVSFITTALAHYLTPLLFADSTASLSALLGLDGTSNGKVSLMALRIIRLRQGSHSSNLLSRVTTIPMPSALIGGVCIDAASLISFLHRSQRQILMIHLLIYHHHLYYACERFLKPTRWGYITSAWFN